VRERLLGTVDFWRVERFVHRYDERLQFLPVSKILKRRGADRDELRERWAPGAASRA
jgi:hypothetical protein